MFRQYPLRFICAYYKLSRI